MVDTVLRADGARIADQVRLPPPQRLVRGDPAKVARIGSHTHHEHISRGLASPLDRDPAIGLVRGQDDIGEAERAALGLSGEPVEQACRATEARLVELGHEIMVVEDQSRAATP